MPTAIQNLQLIDPVLTTVAQGVMNAELIGEMLMPRVGVPAQYFKYLEFSRADFVLSDDEWALRAKIKRFDFEHALKEGSTVDHALETGRDIREFERGNPALMLGMSSTKVLRNKQLLIREKTIADLARDLNSYDASNRTTLSGTDQWDDYDDSDPIGDVDAAVDQIRQSIGRRPNTMELPYKTFQILRRHPNIIDQVKFTTIKFAENSRVTADQLADLFEIEKVVVGESIYSLDGVLTDVWGDDVILAFVPRTAGEAANWEVPAFGYTFQLNNWPRVATYETNNPKMRNYQTMDSYKPQVTGSDAGYLIKDTLS